MGNIFHIRSNWAGYDFWVWKNDHFDVIMIFKNHDWHGDGKQKATASCVFHYENCRASNEAGGARFRTNNKGNGSLCIRYLTSLNLYQRMPWDYGAFIWFPFIQQAPSKWECDLGSGQSYESICPDLLFNDYALDGLVRTWKKEIQAIAKWLVKKK